jgi:hypothetical protein
MKIAVIIPAREGSMRLKNKNILPFCGRPLMAWTILQARKSRYVTDVYLNTDSEEYAKIGQEYGAQIIMREKEEADVTAGVPQKRAVEKLMAEGKHYDAIIGPLCTSPLKKPGDYDRVIERYMQGDVTRADLMYRRKETCLIKANKKGRFVTEIWDKRFGYLEIAGLGIQKTEECFKQWNRGDKYDSIMDRDGGRYMLKKVHTEYIPVDAEIWQIYDIDYKWDFEFCELLFQHYVLDRYGKDCFD